MPIQTPPPTLLVFASLLLLSWIGAAQIGLAIRLVRGDRLWPEEAPEPVVWGARGVLGLLIFWIGTQFVAASLIPRTEGEPRSPRAVMIATGAMNLALLAFGPTILAWSSRVGRSSIRLLGPEPGRRFVMGIKAWPVLAFWIYLVYFLALRYWGATKHPVEELVRSDRSPATVLLSSLTAVVLAPAAEEFLFRGVLLGWATKVAMLRSRGGEPTEVDPEFEPVAKPGRRPTAAFWVANILVSVLFAAMHGPVWPTPIPLFFLSLGLGVLYQRTGGIAAPLGLHVVFNGITTVLMSLTILSGFEPRPDAEEPPPPPAKSAPPEVGAAVSPRTGEKKPLVLDFRVG